MKIGNLKLSWLIPVVGIALFAAGVLAGRTYLDLERKTYSGQAFSATLDRLCQSQRLSAALETLHDGDGASAAQQLDLLLCENILIINSELASTNDRERAYVRDIFARIAHQRPKNSDASAGNAQKLNNDRIEAEKILTRACVEITQAN